MTDVSVQILDFIFDQKRPSGGKIALTPFGGFGAFFANKVLGYDPADATAPFVDATTVGVGSATYFFPTAPQPSFSAPPVQQVLAAPVPPYQGSGGSQASSSSSMGGQPVPVPAGNPPSGSAPVPAAVPQTGALPASAGGFESWFKTGQQAITSDWKGKGGAGSSMGNKFLTMEGQTQVGGTVMVLPGAGTLSAQRENLVDKTIVLFSADNNYYGLHAGESGSWIVKVPVGTTNLSILALPEAAAGEKTGYTRKGIVGTSNVTPMNDFIKTFEEKKDSILWTFAGWILFHSSNDNMQYTKTN